MTAKYPLEVLLRVKHQASKTRELELGERQGAASEARLAAEMATADLAARQRGLKAAIAEEQARVQAGTAKVRDLVRAHEYAEHARRTLQALSAQTRDVVQRAQQAEQSAGVARSRLTEAMAECKALDGEKQRWAAEQQRTAESRSEEAADEAWLAARHAEKGSP